MKLCI